MNELALWTDVLNRLGWVLVHFLWQGAVIGALAGLVSSLMPRTAPQGRYVILCLALGLCGAVPVVTWFALGPQVFTVASAASGHAAASPHLEANQAPAATAPPSGPQILSSSATGTAAPPAPAPLGKILSATLPYLVLAWLIGVFVLSFQLVFGWLRLRWLCAACLPVGERWRGRLDQLCAQMEITRVIRFIASARVDVPAVFGWWKPVLIVPATFLTSLPPDQIEAILVHELAHIRRHDYLINILQLVIETLLFYHPAVWWIGRAIRAERENCCDDLAVRMIGDRLTYVAALAKLAESSSGPLAITLAATGGTLLDRVRRILGEREVRAFRHAWFGPLALAFILAAIIGAGVYSYAEQAQVEDDDPFGTMNLAEGNSDVRGSVAMAFRNAVIADKLKLAEAFLRHGMPVNPSVVAGGGDDILSDAAWFTRDPLMVTMLLEHGAKPLGNAHAWNSTVNSVIRLGDKKIADLLIKAGGEYDPIWYDAAFGLLDDLKKRDAATPIDAKTARGALDRADPTTFDWLWAKARTNDSSKDSKKLGDIYNQAASDGHLPLVLHLEQMGVKPADGGEHALASAIIWGREPVARHLLETGVKLPPKPDPMVLGFPLRDSAGEGRMDMVKLLLAHGADINGTDSKVMTPLSWALYNGKDEMAQFLIGQGTDLNIPDKYGRTAVWYAAGSNHSPGALESMLKKGVHINWTDSTGGSLLGYAMNFVPPQKGVLGFPGEILTPAELRDYETREERVIDLLVSAGLDPSGKEGADTPLKIVLDANHYPAARALLRHHPDINIKDAQGNPAITYLFNNCHSAFPLDVLETLLQQGADPNGSYPIPGMTPRVNFTVLQTAMGSFRGPGGSPLGDQRAAIKMLIDHGAKFPGVKSYADQAMLVAAAGGNQAGMKTALAKGASPDAKDTYGYSPMLISMTLQYFDNVIWLLKNGADPKKNSTMWGNQLISAAVSANRLDMVKLFLSKGLTASGGDSGLGVAVQYGNREMFDTLIKAGADPKSASIFTCIQFGQPEMARILLDGGADPQPPPFGENRANVYWAIYYNQPAILKMLLDHGADPTMVSAYGETPLSEARQWHKDMVPVIEDALKRWPQLSAGGAVPPDMQDLAQKAADDLKQADYDKASAKFEQMTKAHPDSLYAWSNLGASRFQRMRYTDARDAFEHAVKLKPDDAFAVFNLGMTYYRIDAYDKAVATLKTAIQLVPADANAHYFLGLAYASLRQQKEADAEFQKAREIQSKASPSH